MLNGAVGFNFGRQAVERVGWGRCRDAEGVMSFELENYRKTINGASGAICNHIVRFSAGARSDGGGGGVGGSSIAVH